MKNTNKTVLKLLVTARVKKGVTQAQLAKRLGCVGQFISNFERGCCVLPVDKLAMYADTVGIERPKLIAALKKDFDNSLKEAFNKI